MLHAVLRTAAGGGTPSPVIPEWYDIIGSAICFIIILAFFWKYALPRMQKLLDERGEAIEGNIERADEAQRQAEAMLEEYTAKLADARTDATRIRDAAREDGKRILAEAKEQAASEAARITATAMAQIEAERNSTIVALRAEVGTLAIDLASSVIGETLSDDKKAQNVVDRFLADLEESERATVGGKK